MQLVLVERLAGEQHLTGVVLDEKDVDGVGGGRRLSHGGSLGRSGLCLARPVYDSSSGLTLTVARYAGWIQSSGTVEEVRALGTHSLVTGCDSARTGRTG
ncbi:hypothetical protein GCM10009682_30270 [Luedemannella flava]|uniref:Uncharacterized protein n=1 Tax=Luedemannella flava TaxID=349316 RepID=A0ABN2M210_9ACTN